MHRVVRMRADEAVYIERQASGYGVVRCCDHLDVFHTDQNLSNGGYFRKCNINGCSCEQDEPPTKLRRLMDAQDAALDRTERKNERDAFFLLGCAVTGLAWALWAVFS